MKRLPAAIALLVVAGSVFASDAATGEGDVQRGLQVYGRYCALCHGTNGDGTGRAAKLYTPKPANLVTSDKNDDYKQLIIRHGGKAVARSDAMPAWSEELTDAQIVDVVAYLRSIQVAGTGEK